MTIDESQTQIGNGDQKTSRPTDRQTNRLIYDRPTDNKTNSVKSVTDGETIYNGADLNRC